jgi:hypothetical protein
MLFCFSSKTLLGAGHPNNGQLRAIHDLCHSVILPQTGLSLHQMQRIPHSNEVLTFFLLSSCLLVMQSNHILEDSSGHEIDRSQETSLIGAIRLGDRLEFGNWYE